MPLRSSRGQWDLLGLGVELQSEQVPLLGQSEGLALTMWPLPDPQGLVGRSGRFPPMVEPDRAGRLTVVQHPVVLHFSDQVPLTDTTTEEYMDYHLAEEDAPDWDLFPLKVGDLAIPVDYMPPVHLSAPIGDDMLGARVVWDCWPVTEQQADEITRAASQAIWGCDFEQMLDVASAREVGELDWDGPEVAILDHGDPRPVLNLSPDLDRLWRRMKQGSRMNWSAVLDATTDSLEPKSAERRPERMFNPWSSSSL